MKKVIIVILGSIIGWGALTLASSPQNTIKGTDLQPAQTVEQLQPAATVQQLQPAATVCQLQ